MEQIDKLIQSKQSRRRFLAGAGAVGAVGAATLLTGCNDSSSSSGTTPTPTPTPSPLDIPDNDILNFALNLEYLEATFYMYAATGGDLPASALTYGSGKITGGAKVATFNTAQQAYANEIAQAELNHVLAIQATIAANKGTPIARPDIDITFSAVATAAGLPASFSPYSDVLPYLVSAFVFEDVGVTAYNGAAPSITSTTILDAAAGIVAVEAYHAAELRSRIVGFGDATYLGYANQIIQLRGKLGGGGETTLSSTSIVAADNNAIGFSRSTSQVLSIVYGGGTSKGAFFPSGVNGTITTVS